MKFSAELIPEAAFFIQKWDRLIMLWVGAA